MASHPSAKKGAKSNPSDLVCKKCWNDIFTSTSFAKACQRPTFTPSGNRPPDVPTHNYSARIEDIRTSAASGCNWCSLLINITSDKRPLADGPVSIAFHHDENPRQSEQSWFVVRMGTESEKGPNGTYIWGGPGHARTGMFYGFGYAEKDDIAFDFIKGQKPDPGVATDKAFGQVKSWIDQCGTHEHCAAQQDTLLPTRVIDVSSKANPFIVKSNGRSGQYVALSYCWGQQRGLTLNDNLKARLDKLDLNEVSQSIKDAIFCAQRLGYQYIWIDALCIIQDSHDDKVKEIGNMKNIYSDAVLTIVAASAQSAHEGFLHDRSTLTYYNLPYPHPNGDFGTFSMAKYYASTPVPPNPIDTRGWTLQEFLLPPRLLVYSKERVYYRCHTSTVGLGDVVQRVIERLPAEYFQPVRPGIVLSKERKAEVLQDWVRLVYSFTERNLTSQTDRLNAIGGIAELFANLLNTRYLCGIWDTKGDEFLKQLLWTAHGDKSGQRKVYRAPSWSWASLECQTGYGNDMYGFESFHCEVLEAKMTLADHALLFGFAKDGHLKLRGRLRRARMEKGWQLVLKVNTGPLFVTNAANNIEEDSDYDSDESYKPSLAEQTRGFLDSDTDPANDAAWVYLLMLGKSYPKYDGLRQWSKKASGEGLMLQVVDEARLMFRRIGKFSTGKAGGYAEDWPASDVTII